MNKPTILFTANTYSTFVKRDIALLERDYNVVTHITGQPKSLVQFLKASFNSLFFYLKNTRKAKFIYCWFADYHSLWPAIFSNWFKKDFFLVEGGYDTVYLDDYDYGVFTNPYRTFSAKYAIKSATMNLPVSNFLNKELQDLIKRRINITTVQTGYDPEAFVPALKKNQVLSIAHVDTQKRLAIKGIDRVVELSGLMPDTEFHIVGVANNLITGLNAPDNVIFIDFLEEDKLQEKLATAKVYVQFSVREGLPNAIFEAMLCECVTVGINHSGLAEAINEKGFLLESWNALEAKELVRIALENNELGPAGRDYVLNNFTLENRYSRLKAIINK